MGIQRTFKCNKCNYSVLTSAGKDYGMDAVIDTYICKSCKKIVDVLVGQHGMTYRKSDILNRKKEKVLGLQFYTCPECGSKTDMVKWKTRLRPCPRCDGKMEVDPEGVEILWD